LPIDNDTAILTGGSGGGMNPNRMFTYTSVPDPGLNDRTTAVIVGKCVGGSSAVNGMVFHRGTAIDYDIWQSLGGPGSDWGWSGILPYFKKGVHHTPPTQAFRDAFGMTYEPSVWGQDPNTHIYATFNEFGSGTTSKDPSDFSPIIAKSSDVV
jgi:choline dehydrogenase-like flavoprotein